MSNLCVSFLTFFMLKCFLSSLNEPSIPKKTSNNLVIIAKKTNFAV